MPKIKMKKRIKINGMIIFLCVALIAVFPAKFLRLKVSRLDLWAQIPGMFLMLFGMLLRVSSRGFKSEHSEAGKSLVTEGPYALVRNPMYLGISCIALGLILVMFQWWTLAVFAVFFILRYITLIFKEEKMLKNNFGQQYIDYQKKVPRTLPRLGVLFAGKIPGYLPLKGRWIKAEMNSILPLLIVVYGFALWRGMSGFLLLVTLTIIFAAFSGFLSRHDEKISD